MARPFMFAALCQRAHPLKHSLAEFIFVRRVRKTAEKIFVSRKILQQGHSLAEVSLYFLYVRFVRCVKNKAVPLEAWTGPEGSRKLKFLDFVTTAQDGGKVVSLAHRPPLPPGSTLGTHFCQRLSRPHGFYVNENSTDSSWDRTNDLPLCSTAQ